MRGEVLVPPNPETAFRSAVDSIKKAQQAYVCPPWIENDGDYWRDGTFNIHAYDPRRPHIPKGKAFILESNPEWILEDPFDLDNLRMLQKEQIEGFLFSLEELARKPEEEERHKHISAMFGTGGTIAMHEEEREGKKVLVPGISAEQLLVRSGGGIKERFAVASLDFPTTMDSAEMEIDYNAELAIAMSYIWKNASEELTRRFIGFVVAHGTDTMAASGAYLTMMLGPNCPFSVGIVGAQQPTEKRHTDVFENVRLVFDSLEDLKEAGIRERFIAMGGTAGGAYPAVAVEKISDRLVTAFGTFTHPLVINAADFAAEGVNDPFVNEYRKKAAVMLANPWNYREFYPIILRGYNHIVALIPQEGDDPHQIYNQIHISKAARFIDITTFGGFTVNTKIRKAVMAAAQETGKKVLAANPFPQGKLDHAYEPAVKLRDAGVQVTGIPPTALRAKILLGQRLFGDNQAKILNFIENRNFVGEQPPQYWDTYTQERDAAWVDLSRIDSRSPIVVNLLKEMFAAFSRVGPGMPDGAIKVLYSGKVPQEPNS